MNDMDMVDVSEKENVELPKKKDKFMIFVYVSLIVLIVLGLLTYFFGYDLLKPYIKV